MKSSLLFAALKGSGEPRGELNDQSAGKGQACPLMRWSQPLKAALHVARNTRKDQAELFFIVTHGYVLYH